MIDFLKIYKSKKVLITGHNGFKGSWLSLWLQKLGAKVYGISLKNEDKNNHFNALNLDIEQYHFNICDYQTLENKVLSINPDIIFHLAAQSLVRESFISPIETWNTNVIGTANLLEIVKKLNSVKGLILISSDKCYKNKEWIWGYRENDELGGHDPYSSSKAAMELLISSYRDSFYYKKNKSILASCRAGNVIGGGDWARDRLMPDIFNSIYKKTNLNIRYPEATRPWQHVLESLNGYLMLGKKILEDKKHFGKAWNFGPNQDSNLSVLQLLKKIKSNIGYLNWEIANHKKEHESKLLFLDNSMAKKELLWKPVLDIEKTLEFTINWYKVYLEENKIISSEQIDEYINLAGDDKLVSL
ncbi:MAG: CDP-glucose 4,6-dehydratase [Candidatus Endolissoclinum sp. TMED37]|nr:MAG: CDP-glucose 4,6-dehydratase [Candidatus Endolissoclinum sp. TMED37]|tara:strand:+ start:57 stop:1130 length:1074 start_codon:yes stop_codon:yes gene_type:complete